MLTAPKSKSFYVPWKSKNAVPCDGPECWICAMQADILGAYPPYYGA